MTSESACRPEASLSCFGACPRRQALVKVVPDGSLLKGPCRGASRTLTADTLAMAWYLGSWSAGSCIEAMVQLHNCSTETVSRSCCPCIQLLSVFLIPQPSAQHDLVGNASLVEDGGEQYSPCLCKVALDVQHKGNVQQPHLCDVGAG